MECPIRILMESPNNGGGPRVFGVECVCLVQRGRGMENNSQHGLILAIEASITRSKLGRAAPMPYNGESPSLGIRCSGRNPSSVGSQTGDVPPFGSCGNSRWSHIIRVIISEPENQIWSRTELAEVLGRRVA